MIYTLSADGKTKTVILPNLLSFTDDIDDLAFNDDYRYFLGKTFIDNMYNPWFFIDGIGYRCPDNYEEIKEHFIAAGATKVKIEDERW